MKYAVLVQAHKNPNQIRRMLLPFMGDPEFDIYINIDRKVPIEPFEKSIPEARFIKNRVPIFWSNISQVVGMLNSWNEIREVHTDYDYHIFMSGQDYLLRPLSELKEFLKTNKGAEFVEFEEISEAGLNWSVRFNKYHCTHKPPFIQKIAQLVRKLPWPIRKYPIFEKQYGGSAWMMLTDAAVAYVLEFCGMHPEFVGFHTYSHCPDEYFFQTILVNSPFRDRIVNNNYWYLDWFNQHNNPKILRSVHVERILGSGNFFARKFDETVDSKILDLIDKSRDGDQL